MTVDNISLGMLVVFCNPLLDEPFKTQVTGKPFEDPALGWCVQLANVAFPVRTCNLTEVVEINNDKKPCIKVETFVDLAKFEAVIAEVMNYLNSLKAEGCHDEYIVTPEENDTINKILNKLIQ